MFLCLDIIAAGRVNRGQRGNYFLTPGWSFGFYPPRLLKVQMRGDLIMADITAERITPITRHVSFAQNKELDFFKTKIARFGQKIVSFLDHYLFTTMFYF